MQRAVLRRMGDSIAFTRISRSWVRSGYMWSRKVVFWCHREELNRVRSPQRD
jgi:hypothetical protein